MATNTTSSAKTHVSLRLPTSILESIDAHAEKEHISRTEAFVYYLQTGLEISDAQANEPSKDEVLLQSIQDDLTVIKALLQTQPGAATAPHPYTVPAVEIPEEPTQEEAVASEFTTSDEVEEPEETQEVEEDEDEGVTVSLKSEPEPDLAEEAEALAEEDYSTSDATSREESSTAAYSLYAIGEEESFTEIKPVDELDEASEFTTSDAVSEEDPAEEVDTVDPSEDESDFTTSDATEGGEVLSLKKLEKAVSKAAKDIASIEKVWLYGSAADAKEIEGSSIDLCVKTEDDDKLKSKHLDAFVAINRRKDRQASQCGAQARSRQRPQAGYEEQSRTLQEVRYVLINQKSRSLKRLFYARNSFCAYCSAVASEVVKSSSASSAALESSSSHASLRASRGSSVPSISSSSFKPSMKLGAGPM